MPHAPTKDVAGTSVMRRRGTALLIFAATTCFTFFVFAGASGLALYRLLTDGALTLVWLVAAYGIGAVFFPRRDEPGLRLFRGVCATAVGLGVLSLVTLGLGLLGWLNRPMAFALIALGVALAVIRLRRYNAAQLGQWLRQPAGWGWAGLVAAPFLGLSLIAALVPPGVLWGDEPNGYDVVEYHLQIPREWHEAGRITRLDHNVFSYFPQGVEMHFLLAMHLRGGAWEGMYLAQFMHVAFVALAALAVYAGAAGLGAPMPAAAVAAAAAASTPWMSLLAPIAYNEGALLLYGTLAIVCALHALRERFARSSVILTGVMVGFACGAKLTSGPTLLVGLPLAWIALGLLKEPKRVLSSSILMGVIALAVFSPWMVRTAAWAGGNPVFPEAQNVLGRGRFAPEQTERWQRAHAPAESQRSVTGRFAALRDQVLLDWRFSYMLLPLALLAAGLTWARPETRMLIALLAVLGVFWLSMTHMQGRFFVLAIPIAALLIGQLQQARLIALAAAGVGVYAIIALGALVTKFAPTADAFRDASAFGVTQLDFMIPPEAAEVIEAGMPLDLAGDARAFLYPLPMSRLRYRTVFDVNAAPGHSAIDAWRGSPRDNVAVLVDPSEIRRLSRTYFAILPLPPGAPQQPYLIRPPAR